MWKHLGLPIGPNIYACDSCSSSGECETEHTIKEVVPTMVRGMMISCNFPHHEYSKEGHTRLLITNMDVESTPNQVLEGTHRVVDTESTYTLLLIAKEIDNGS